MVLALPELAWILFWVGALIFCYLVVYITKALFGVAGGAFGWIPGIGGWLKSSLHGIEQRIVSVMSGAALQADRKIGAGFHDLARLTDWLGREIRAHANLIYLVASVLTGTAGITWVSGEIGRLVGRIRASAHTADVAVQRVLGLEKRVQHSIAATVLPRLRAAEHTLDVTIPRDVAGLRARTKTIEGELARAWKAIRKNEAALVGTAFLGAIALALARLGLGWTRCSNWNRIGKSVCAVNPLAVEELLGLIVTGVAIADFRELVKLAQSVERETAQGIQTLLRV